MRAREELESASRRGARWVPGIDEHSACCRVLDSFWLYVDTRDTSLSSCLLRDGFWEAWTTLAIMRHVKPGMACVDVGSNLGYFALLMAKMVGENGDVMAFEPQNRLTDLCVSSVVINGLVDNLDIFASALGAKEEWRDLLRYGSDFCNTMLGDTRTNDMPGAQVLTMDAAIAEDDDKVDFIKVDAEGSESEIWDGMQRILRKHRPTVALEFGRRFYPEPGSVLRKFTNSGYALGVIESDGSIAPSSEGELLGGDHADKEMLWLVPK